MDYKILGQTVPVVEVTMNNGESMYTQTGGMTYQTDGIKMRTNARGGLMKSLGRVFTGESIFMTNYDAEKDGATIAFATTVPGTILPIDLDKYDEGMIFQKGAFLCAEQSIDVKVTFTKKLGAAFFGGEGLILQKATGNGMLFLEVDGDVIEKELKDGEILKVDTGNVVGFEPSVTYTVEMVKGLRKHIFRWRRIILNKACRTR